MKQRTGLYCLSKAGKEGWKLDTPNTGHTHTHTMMKLIHGGRVGRKGRLADRVMGRASLMFSWYYYIMRRPQWKLVACQMTYYDA